MSWQFTSSLSSNSLPTSNLAFTKISFSNQEVLYLENVDENSIVQIYINNIIESTIGTLALDEGVLDSENPDVISTLEAYSNWTAIYNKQAKTMEIKLASSQSGVILYNSI